MDKLNGLKVISELTAAHARTGRADPLNVENQPCITVS